MITGKKVILRPVSGEDLDLVESWGQTRDKLWGAYQRYQIDHISSIKKAVQSSDLLSREGGMLLIESLQGAQVVGMVRYSMCDLPDADHPYPEIGFVITEVTARGKGYGREAVELLVNYLFASYPAQRIGAVTDVENIPAQRLLESLGFEREGVMRKSYFRDGEWQDMAFYARLRS